jgi:hypothetical protein
MFTHTGLPALLSLTVAAMALLAGHAQAADNTRYIGIAGNNANPCTLAQPCRSLQKAIGVTLAGGEIQILDSGFYGNNATINKSLTITGNGHTVYLGAVLTINKADAVVALRGLVLNGQGTIAEGIRITTAAAVHIERCVVHNFTSHGIVATAPDVKVFVLDSIVRDNGGHGFTISGAGASHVTIDNSRVENNHGTGVLVSGGLAAIHRSTVSRHVSQGIFVDGGSAVSVTSTMSVENPTGFFVKSGSTLTMESSLAHGNGTGLFVTGSTARISNSTFTENTIGINNSGVVETRQNNTVRGNTTDVNGALTPIGGI